MKTNFYKAEYPDSTTAPQHHNGFLQCHLERRVQMEKMNKKKTGGESKRDHHK
jgi:hypothetical protein